MANFLTVVVTGVGVGNYTSFMHKKAIHVNPLLKVRFWVSLVSLVSHTSPSNYEVFANEEDV